MIMTGGFRQKPAGHNFFTPGGVYTKCKGVYNKCCICAALCAANRTEKEQRRRMEQKRTAPRAQKTQPLTYREWKRRKQLRLARNWGLFLAGCALVVFLLIIFIFCRVICSALSRNRSWRARCYLAGAIGGVGGFMAQSMTDYTFYNYRVALLFFAVLALGASFARLAEQEVEDR